MTNTICPTCTGYGDIDTGRREDDTGAVIMAECPECHGTGEVECCEQCGEPLSPADWDAIETRRSEALICMDCDDQNGRDEAGDAAYERSIDA